MSSTIYLETAANCAMPFSQRSIDRERLRRLAALSPDI
jgi:hypothetical protein